MEEHRRHRSSLSLSPHEVNHQCKQTDGYTSTEGPTKENVKTITVLDLLVGQLNQKEKLLTDLDAKILQLVNDKGELEAEVFEVEEIQSKITETVSNIKSFTTH